MFRGLQAVEIVPHEPLLDGQRLAGAEGIRSPRPGRAAGRRR
ncbi:MAG: hypothetical protein U5L11_15470 [Arhodomonas sp.]|nr:hypothetical protein [Arhodomonas sp.]